MNKTITFLPEDRDKNLRLDKFLAEKLKTLTRSQERYSAGHRHRKI